MVDNPGHERIVLSLDLASDPGGTRRRWCCPCPGCPRSRRSSTATRSPTWTRRRPRSSTGAVGGGAPDESAASPVDVIGRETVGGYDVARLASGEAGALDAWLRRNGYALPDGAEPILADYVDRGWRFVAIRLAQGEEGRLKPLDVSFATDAPVYPMRLEQLASSACRPHAVHARGRRPDGRRPADDIRGLGRGPVAAAPAGARGSVRGGQRGDPARGDRRRARRVHRRPRDRSGRHDPGGRSAPAPRIPTGRRSARSPPPWR